MARARRYPVPLWALLALLLVVAVAGLALWGWLRAPADSEREVTLYYADAQAMYLVPVSRHEALPRDDAGALTVMLAELAQAPAGLQAPLPAGTLPAVQSISNGQANISLRLPVSMGSGGERILAGAVVKTAASLESVREVRLRLFNRQGAPYESQHLDLSTALSPGDPGVENLYLEGGQEGLLVTIYYLTPDGRYLLPVRRSLPAAYRAQPLEGSFQLLLAGPPSDLSGILAPVLPAHAAISWGGVSEGTARLNWPADLAPPSELAMRALALTLTEYASVRQVSVMQDSRLLARSARPEAINILPPLPSAAPSAVPSPAASVSSAF